MQNVLKNRSEFGKNNPSCWLKLCRFLLIFAILLPHISSAPTNVAQAAAAPTLIAPADFVLITATGEDSSLGAPPLALPEFTWSAVEGATSYRIQFSQDTGFISSIEFITPLTRFTPTQANKFSDGIWYWRVRVDAPKASVSMFSDQRMFTRQWASPNNAPRLKAPASSATLGFFDPPNFSWEPVIGAAVYRVEIASDDAFTQISLKTDTIYTTYQPIQKLASGNYFWRVTPLDPANRLGTPSEVLPFTLSYNQAPELIEPANLSFPDFTPTFHWNAVRGAQSYELQYSTDPTFNSSVTTISTPSTRYTPNNTLPNDTNYFWRVRVKSGSSISPWSSVSQFTKHWYYQPRLLTPSIPSPYVRLPLFSWAPVSGASYYKFELDDSNDFKSPIVTANTSSPFYTPDTYSGVSRTLYWRVTPFDGGGKSGKPSTSSSYVSSETNNTPSLVYPLYYYPNNQNVQKEADRTVPYPIFIWNKLTDVNSGAHLAAFYILEVCTDNLCNNKVWTAETENSYIAPATRAEFSPIVGIDYFWRVRALNVEKQMIGYWSQTWLARFDESRGIPMGGNMNIVLLRPAQASENVEATPIFEWQPIQDAAWYNIEISLNADYSSPIEQSTVDYPFYASSSRLAQRDAGKLNFGTYYWRVRGVTSDGMQGPWSAGRFQIAAQSQWKYSRTLGSSENRSQIASDGSGDATPDFDLNRLYATRAEGLWFFGFDFSGSSNSRYVLFLDLDHEDYSGAGFAPEGISASAISAHYPEYSIVIEKTGGTFTASKVRIYRWEGDAWSNPITLDTLSTFNAGLYQASDYIEISVPDTYIGMDVSTGSYGLSVFTVPVSSGGPVDSTPADPGIPGGTEIRRFTSVSERINLLQPPSNIQGDPSVYSDILPFFWEYPAGAPWAGAYMEIYLDPTYLNQVANYKVTSNGEYYAYTVHPWANDFTGDNTYYWRIRPCYLGGCQYYGPWSEGWRFERTGLIPDLVDPVNASILQYTPTFSWQRVQGAEKYDLQVSTDPNFGSTIINTTTTEPSFTPTNSLPNGTYYWRLRVKRHGGETNAWSAANNFQLALPLPGNLTPNDPGAKNVVGKAPTFCWDSVVLNEGEVPAFTAYKYRLQISKGDPTFSRNYESVETEQSCYTPTRGYDDGEYFWRVAMIDGQTKVGDFSATASFTKQYPIPALISPVDITVPETPDFVWTRVEGAASYKFEISRFETFASLIDSGTTQNTRFTPTKNYPKDIIYYWRVAIIDKDGKVGPFSDARIILGTQPLPGAHKFFLPFIRR